MGLEHPGRVQRDWSKEIWEDDLPLDMAERDCGVVLLHCKYLEVPILLTSSSMQNNITSLFRKK